MDDPSGIHTTLQTIHPGIILMSASEYLVPSILTLILLACSGFISASEVAFFSIRPNNLDAIPESTAKDNLVKILDTPKTLLATILIMNNMVNIGIVIITDDMVHSIEMQNTPEWVRFLFQVVSVTFLILLFGEVIPKVYANRNPVRISLLMAYPIRIFTRIFKPLTYPLTSTTNFLDKKLKKKENSLSVSELSHALELTGLDTEDEGDHKILRGIVEFGTVEVSNIMTPRVDVSAVDVEVNYTELLDFIRNSGYSRLPVYTESIDQVEGVLYVKDLLPYLNESEAFEWKNLIRKPFFVPENKKIDDLLHEFQSRHMHMAVVVDEFGGCSGIITLEDIIEEIVGEINDEYDEVDTGCRKIDENTFIMEGKTGIKDFCRIAGIADDYFDEINIDSDTVAGIILELAGRIPDKYDIVRYKELEFKIQSVDQRKINVIRVIRKPEEENERKHHGTKLPFLILSVMFLVSGCGGTDMWIPKPKGYPVIEFPKKKYIEYDSVCPFTFRYPAYAKITPYKRDASRTCWFNLEFPSYKATLYISYEKVNDNINKYTEDSRELAYKHVVKAGNIEELLINDPGAKVYGIIYEIQGDVATPCQFHLTDSTTHFLRASFYFDKRVNTDSVAPIYSFLRKDITELTETLRWK